MQRKVSVEVDADLNPFNRSVATGTAVWKGFVRELESGEKSSARTGAEIDRLSGRLRLMTDLGLSLGPAFLPLGASVVPAISGLTAGLGAAAGAAGTALLAFVGLGDAMDAIDKAQLEPTTENLEEMRAAFDNVGRAGAEFAVYLDNLEPVLRDLQFTSREGFFPGVQQGIDEVLDLLPQVERTVASISQEMGGLSAEAGANLAGPEFADFFDYVERTAAPTLDAFARATGNVAQGLADLFVDLEPLTDDFTRGLVDSSAAFANWADGVGQTEGFEEFVDYVRDSGPQAIELLSSLADATVAVATAAAPVGDVALPVLTALADVIGTIADSPVGPQLYSAAAGFLLLNRASAGLSPRLASISDAFLDLRTSPNLAATAVERFGRVARVAAGAGGMALLVDGAGRAGSSFGTLESAAGGALAGFAVGGPWGAAIGGAVGALGSLAMANDDSSAYVRDLTSSLNEQTGALTANSRSVAAKALEDAGALKIAEDLGLNLDLVTSAALGNEGAMAMLNDQLSRYADVTDSSGAVDQELFRQREEADKLVTTLNDLATDTDSVISGQRRLAAAAEGTTVAFRRQALQVERSRAIARETASSFIGLGDSFDDAKTSLRDWIQELEQQARALERFGENAAKAADRGLRQGLIDALEEAGPAGALRMRQLANASEAEIGRANRAWGDGQQAIRDYTDLIGGVPPAEIDVDPSGALAAINRVTTAMAQIHDKDVRLTYYVNQVNAANVTAGGGRDGDPSTPYAGGGWTGPGGTWEPAGIVHRDEFVVRKAARMQLEVARPGWLDQMNTTGRWPGYDGGGRVKPWSPPAARTDRHMARPVALPRYASTASAPAVAVSLDGAQISGRLQLSADGQWGFLDGRIVGIARDEIRAEKRFDRMHAGR